MACSMQAGRGLAIYRDILERRCESLRIGFAPDVSNCPRWAAGVATVDSELRSRAPPAPESCAKFRRAFAGARAKLEASERP